MRVDELSEGKGGVSLLGLCELRGVIVILVLLRLTNYDGDYQNFERRCLFHRGSTRLSASSKSKAGRTSSFLTAPSWIFAFAFLFFSFFLSPSSFLGGVGRLCMFQVLQGCAGWNSKTGAGLDRRFAKPLGCGRLCHPTLRQPRLLLGLLRYLITSFPSRPHLSPFFGRIKLSTPLS